jgi:hypothetical protein
MKRNDLKMMWVEKRSLLRIGNTEEYLCLILCSFSFISNHRNTPFVWTWNLSVFYLLYSSTHFQCICISTLSQQIIFFSYTHHVTSFHHRRKRENENELISFSHHRSIDLFSFSSSSSFSFSHQTEDNYSFEYTIYFKSKCEMTFFFKSIMRNISFSIKHLFSLWIIRNCQDTWHQDIIPFVRINEAK